MSCNERGLQCSVAAINEDEEEISKKLDIFKKKINKKVFVISALKHIGLKTIKEKLFSHVH